MLLPETLKLHDKRQFDFHYLFFLPWKDQMVDSIQQNGGKVTCFKSNNNIQLMMKVVKVVRYVRKHKIQLIHAHLPWAGIIARVVGKLCGVPVIYSEHNKLERYHRITRLVNLLTLEFLTTLVAVSNDVAESIHKHKPHLKIPVRVIFNGVNTQHFNKVSTGKEIREKLGIPFDAPVIGTIAVFRPQKRLDVWMELAEKILRQFNNAHFIIVGDGPLRMDLIAKRDALGLTNRIHMPGLQTEVRPYLSTFDVFMMSSVFEGLPVALLEAMAMQCAVIATDAGGIKEVIRHELDGMLCSVEDPEQLVGYACTILQNPEQRSKCGDQARKRVIESFSIKSMVNALENLYKGVLGHNAV